MNANASYRALLDDVIRPLLSQPDAFTVDESRVKNAVSLEFEVAPDDVGRVIGKGGMTIRAIRTLLEFAGDRVDDRIAVELKGD